MADQSISAIILTGGRSQRMGQDKAKLELAGQPLALYVARRVMPLAGELIFSARSSEELAPLVAELSETLPTRVVVDRRAGAGPLAGLEACLAAARHDLALLVAVDMPFLNRPLLRYMIEQAAGYDAVVPIVGSRTDGRQEREPLHAIYRRSCLPAISDRLDRGERRVVAFYDDVRVRDITPDEIAGFDPELWTFFNANTPEEWEKARARVEASGT